MGYEEVEHTADWALRVRGRDLAELLENAVAGTLELAGVVLDQGSGTRRDIELESLDAESLVVDFLTELVVALELHATAFQDLRLQVEAERRLHGSLREVPVAHMAKPIKAVTYSELEVQRDQHGYSATIVFDV